MLTQSPDMGEFARLWGSFLFLLYTHTQSPQRACLVISGSECELCDALEAKGATGMERGGSMCVCVYPGHCRRMSECVDV